MTYQFDGYNYLLKLNRGESLTDSLKQLMKAEQIRGAYISAIGGAAHATLGYYDLKIQQYHWKEVNALLEIVSLQGTLAWADDEPAIHLHGLLSDENMAALGGHIKELTVSGTCEVFIHIWNKNKLTRSEDLDTGLKLLDL